MKKWHLISILAIVISLTLGASINYSNVPNPGKDGGFKNLKILPKDISDKDLDSIMHQYSMSLGVRCGFCHAKNKDTAIKRLDFPSDEKEEKNTARTMIKMTAYLNTTFFNPDNSTKPDTIHAVICYTCHRGSNEVDSKVFLARLDSIDAAHRKKQRQVAPK